MDRVTQVEIARRVCMDVSSVNKILNETEGPVFAKATIKRVKLVASKLGFCRWCIGCRVELTPVIASYKLPKGKRICTYCAASVIAQVSNEVSTPRAVQA